MKAKFPLLCVALLAIGAGVASAEDPPGDPIHRLLIPPEILIQHREEIGLSEKQIAQIRTRLEQDGPKLQERQARLDRAIGQFAELLSGEKVDEEAALKKLDELLAIEKDLKAAHLRILIQIRNELTVEQRQVATRIQHKPKSDEGVEDRLQAKLSRIEREVQKRAQAGQPPQEAVGLMQKFPELMQNGQVREAEGLLDRVLAMLRLGQEDKAARGRKPNGPDRKISEKIQRLLVRAQQLQQDGKDISGIRTQMEKIAALVQAGKTKEAEKLLEEALERAGVKAESKKETPRKEKPKTEEKPKTGGNPPANEPRRRDRKPGPALSPDAVQAQVEALKKEDVAWRKIAWKTCLLEGLQASREQKKPIILWIFIDRPIDDERC